MSFSSAVGVVKIKIMFNGGGLTNAWQTISLRPLPDTKNCGAPVMMQTDQRIHWTYHKIMLMTGSALDP